MRISGLSLFLVFVCVCGLNAQAETQAEKRPADAGDYEMLLPSAELRDQMGVAREAYLSFHLDDEL